MEISGLKRDKNIKDFMNERNNKMITITDLLEKGIKPNGKSLTKKVLLEYFEVDEKALENYEDNQMVLFKAVISKK